jgi:hypothetical protein
VDAIVVLGDTVGPIGEFGDCIRVSGEDGPGVGHTLEEAVTCVFDRPIAEFVPPIGSTVSLRASASNWWPQQIPRAGNSRSTAVRTHSLVASIHPSSSYTDDREPETTTPSKPYPLGSRPSETGNTERSASSSRRKFRRVFGSPWEASSNAICGCITLRYRSEIRKTTFSCRKRRSHR